MSRRPRLCSVVLSLLLAGTAAAPSSAPAQQTQQELMARIDALIPEVERAGERAREARDRRLRSEIGDHGTLTDTFAVGPFQVIAVEDQVAEVRALVEETVEERFRGVGDLPGMRHVRFFVQWQMRLAAFGTDGTTHRIEDSPLLPRAEMKNRIASAMRGALSQELGNQRPLVAEWGINGIVRERDLAEIYVQLATNPSATARACLDRDPLACWTALGLDVGERPLEAWYTPEERRSLATRSYSYRRNVDMRDRCLLNDDLSACDEFLMDLTYRRFEPAGQVARADMLWLALDRGGPDAWARILEDTEMEPGDALRYVSGLSTEELATLWRDRVVAARPDVHAGLGLMQLSTLLWTLVFAGLAMRSTRWRLG